MLLCDFLVLMPRRSNLNVNIGVYPLNHRVGLVVYVTSVETTTGLWLMSFILFLHFPGSSGNPFKNSRLSTCYNRSTL